MNIVFLFMFSESTIALQNKLKIKFCLVASKKIGSSAFYVVAEVLFSTSKAGSFACNHGGNNLSGSIGSLDLLWGG